MCLNQKEKSARICGTTGIFKQLKRNLTFKLCLIELKFQEDRQIFAKMHSRLSHIARYAPSP